MSLCRAAAASFAMLFVAVALAACLILFSFADAQLVSAQGSRPEISDPECSFWLDINGDGEGDERFDTGPGQYVLQDAPVVGGCEFTLRTAQPITLKFDSDLFNWSAEVELDREPSRQNNFTVDQASSSITIDITSGMQVKVNITQGHTQRSGREREVADRYRQDAYIHQVQTPDTFRVLGIQAVSTDGLRDSHEENANTASIAYINARQRIIERTGELPEWTIELATEWLDNGYPEVSNSIIDSERGDSGGSQGANWWIWLGMLILGIFIGSVVTGIIGRIVQARQDQMESLAYSDDL